MISFLPLVKSAAGAAQRLAQRTRDDIDPAHHSAMLMCSASRLADETGRMRVVDHDNRIIPVGQIADLIQLRNRPIHAERTVGHNDPAPRPLCRLQLGFEVGHRIVLVAETLRLTKPYPIDNRCMIQLVRDDRILLAE